MTTFFEYRTGPDQRLGWEAKYSHSGLQKIVSSSPSETEGILFFVDNCSAHNLTAEAVKGLQNSRTELPISGMCNRSGQPAHSFVIQCIKPEWRSL